MKRIPLRFTPSVTAALTFAALASGVAFADPLRAASVGPAQSQDSPPASAMVADAKSMPAAQTKTRKSSTPVNMDKDSSESIDEHVKGLHDKFQITAAQEDKWGKVARVMKDNADKLTALTKARSENAKNMTAVDDLKSYAEITEAHETGIGKLLPVFTALYDSFSDAQKKAADAEFREHHHHRNHSPS